jgi:hypothetical protein
MKLHLHVYHEITSHFESTGKACVLFHRVHHLQFCSLTEVQYIMEMVQQSLNFKCSFEDFVAVGDNVL